MVSLQSNGITTLFFRLLRISAFGESNSESSPSIKWTFDFLVRIRNPCIDSGSVQNLLWICILIRRNHVGIWSSNYDAKAF